MKKTKIALAAALFAATSSAAFAQFDPNLANRYPSYADPNTYGYSASGSLGSLPVPPSGTLHSAPVRLQKHSQTNFQSSRKLQQHGVTLSTADGQAPQTGAFWSTQFIRNAEAHRRRAANDFIVMSGFTMSKASAETR